MYDTNAARTKRYAFPITNAGEVYSIKGPKGKAGTLMDYGVNGVTTAFAGATTTPHIMIGTAADDDAYGDEFDFGALADNVSKSVRSTYDPSADPTNWALYMVNRRIPADTAVLLKWVAATGGGAAGVGSAFCDIAWDP